MGSRIREDVRHYFECFCEVVGPQADGTEAWILQKFPDSYRDDEVLKAVPKFAFPCEFENTSVQHYSFVLTSHDSKWTFGFCRHDPKSETALVALSFLPWHESFTKFLNVISGLTHTGQSEDLGKFLDSVYQSKVPDPGGSFQVPIQRDTQDYFTCQSPCQFQLPSIPENRNLTEYYNAVDSNNMMVIFASMLYERRIVFTSRRLNRLSACVQSANAVIYPMSWQHIFIPVLPKQMIDYLLAPMPYLIGVSNSLLGQVRKADMGEVVVLDADNNTVETPFQDLESLPQDVVRNLRSQLRNRAALLGDGVSRAFLRALVQLIGGYRDALKFHPGEKITFNEDAFVESRTTSMQPFLRKMLELQIFQQFIEERLEMLNSGMGFSDEFEMEACTYSDKSSSRLKQQYKDLSYNMRKDTSAFLKNVKSRANPAVKSAVKTVKERGKNVGKAYKGIKSKLRDSTPREEAGPSPPPVAARPRPHTTIITSATSSYRRDLSMKQRFSSVPESRKQYSPLSPSSPEYSTFTISPIDMDLMGDLKDVIFPNSSNPTSPTVDRTLKPVRSLESFPGDKMTMSTPNHSLSQTSAPDLFGASPFIAGDREGTDDSLHLLGSDPFKLLPPPKTSNRSHHKVEETNLIRLDSESSVDDFDPLLSKDKVSEQPQYSRALSLTNPLYPYFTPQHLAQEPCHHDVDLLKEYGLDFNSLSLQSTPARNVSLTPAATTQTSQMNWTKFD